MCGALRESLIASMIEREKERVSEKLANLLMEQLSLLSNQDS